MKCRYGLAMLKYLDDLGANCFPIIGEASEELKVFRVEDWGITYQ